MSHRKNLFILILLGSYVTHGYTHEIALTFDDLPGAPDSSVKKQKPMNQRIIKNLLEFNAPAIGFVNEGKLYTDDEYDAKVQLLTLWIEYGFDLGNHTYSHSALSQLDEHAFQKEVKDGELVSKQLMMNVGKTYHYFRHPYLDTGETVAIRTQAEYFLNGEGYQIAPVTIDTDDWLFNQYLLSHPEEKDKIIKDYLEHTKAKFMFYEQVSYQLFGRNIKHIWLLHVNLINSYVLKELIQCAKELDYHFISLDEALSDAAYQSNDNYYSHYGVSWLYRWDYSGARVVDWSKEPEPKLVETTRLKNRK
ncbi:polysaccharide deacetylase family protein [Legionella anisa]|uniref:polysaccharide deacetylase family protein n=1 Tax=Legionella anisa TaxID=28082 RepID=UPI00399D41A4